MSLLLCTIYRRMFRLRISGQCGTPLWNMASIVSCRASPAMYRALQKPFFNKINNLVGPFLPQPGPVRKRGGASPVKRSTTIDRIEPFQKTYKKVEILLPCKKLKISRILQEILLHFCSFYYLKLMKFNTL